MHKARSSSVEADPSMGSPQTLKVQAMERADRLSAVIDQLQGEGLVHSQPLAYFNSY
jgi:hypothetical protein